MEILLQLIFAMILLELLEIYLYKAETLAEMVDKLFVYYKQSVFLFFILHPTVYFVLGVLLYFDAFNFYGVTILVLKIFDIFFKMELIRQKYYLKQMDSELSKMMNMKLTFSMRFLGLLVHVPLLYMAITAVFG
ncbi:MAG: Unknown protein [uncultured Sulfurovum sp.]|uniref:Uncharacterized protein n=1 Tax=uncultured Sulfurovum sp. TaxID=269237 RepID=A0A6S6TZK5_9BACT|nr:MAG: Unknown protein [uncultured Sulfurovum sp.]